MRRAYWLGFLCIGGLIGFALYLQHVEMLDPCPLCMAQRLAFYAMAVVFFLGAIHFPKGWGRRVYAMLVALTASAGAALAARHLWLQSLPPDQVPACGPSLEYMIQTLPLAEIIRSMLTGSGECAEVLWTFLGLSMPGWTLIWFVALGLWGTYFGWRREPRYLFHGHE